LEVLEVRWHGRGGQGVVTSSQLLALSAIKEGKYAIHIPEFGPERRGAPVRAYTRIDDKVIDIRSSVLNPDIVIVIDPGLVKYREMITEGLKKGGKVIYNTPDPSKAEEFEGFETYVVDAYHIALEVIKRPIYNTAMLGALIGVAKIVSLDTVYDALIERFGEKIGKLNIEAVKRGYEEVKKIG